MAQLALANRSRPLRKNKLYVLGRHWTNAKQTGRSRVRLFFPPEATGFRTQFRAYVYRLIFEEANRIAYSEIESFDISVWSQPGEDDSWMLVMTIFIKSGWDRVKSVRRSLLAHLDELSRGWLPEQREDYRRRVHFEVFPTSP